MNIRQINAAYLPEEDRILLRVTLVGGDELRFWLTRASVRDYLPKAQAWMAASEAPPAPSGRVERSLPAASQAMEAFRREKAAAQSDFSQPLVPGERLPLGEVPVLVTRVELQAEAEKLLLHMVDKRIATMNLGATLLPGTLRLLREVIGGVDWGFQQVAPPVPEQIPTGTLH